MFGDTKYERVNKQRNLQRQKPNQRRNTLQIKCLCGWQMWMKMMKFFPVIDKIIQARTGQTVPLITIIAPHEPTANNIEHIEKKIKENIPISGLSDIQT
jgi:hypothetical protein